MGIYYKRMQLPGYETRTIYWNQDSVSKVSHFSSLSLSSPLPLCFLSI